MALPLALSTSVNPTGGFAGPFKSSGGNFYIIARDSLNANKIIVLKSASPTTSWTTLSGITFTVANAGQPAQAQIGSVDGVQDGDVIHVASALPDATTPTSTRIHYHKFSMASDTWTLSNEAVDGPTATSATTGGQYVSVCIIRRSASVVIAYQMAFVLSMSANYARVGYRERTDAAGTWAAAVALDALGTSTVSAIHIGAIKDPQTNRIHFHWMEGTSLRVRTLSAANVLNTASTTAAGSGSGLTPTNPIRGAAYVSGGVSKVIVIKATGFATTLNGAYFDSADNPTVNASSGTFPANANAGINRVFADNGIAYYLYSDQAANGLYIGQSTNHGATWSGFTLSVSAVMIASDLNVSTNGGQVYVQGSNYVIPYVFNNDNPATYNENSVRAAAAAERNVTTGAQTALASTQSATADADLQISAAQTTLATTQAGTIQAQEARAVTGAQTTLEATQSATASVRLAVTTGTQTTSAATQAAAADVDAKVTGAQNTLATTQSAAADVDLALTGAQNTLATTQSATASAAVRNVTAAQATLATTQSATAGVRLTLTGAQATSAITQAAAADVDLAVTGAAPATLATTQVGTVGLGLAVTGAQTLSAATQSAIADVDLKVTGAQTLSAATQIGSIGAVPIRFVTGAQLLLAPTQSFLADVDVRAIAAQTLTATTQTGSISLATLSKTWIKHAGVWKQATVYAKHAGAWKPATPYVKQGGAWKQA
jgi:hypothetical protein